MKLKIIKGEKVTLKPIDFDHTPLIVQWRNNPKVMHNFVFEKKFTKEMHNEWMNTKIRNAEAIQYIIYENQSGLPIGSVYYRDIDYKNLSAEYGIFIGEDSKRGLGYGSETAKLFVAFGVNVIKLHRIMLRVFTENTFAIESYKKAGFIVEGIAEDFVFKDGEYKNMMFMSLITKQNTPTSIKGDE